MRDTTQDDPFIARITLSYRGRHYGPAEKGTPPYSLLYVMTHQLSNVGGVMPTGQFLAARVPTRPWLC